MEISFYLNKQKQYEALLLDPKKYLDKRKKALKEKKFQNIIKFHSVKISSLLTFTRQFSVLIKAGFSLTRAIDLLIGQQDDDSDFKTVLEFVRFSLLSEGRTLSNSLALFPEVFSPLYLHIIFAGEQEGHLDKAFIRLADILEQNFALYSKIRSALTYPVFVCSLSFLLVFVGVRLLLPSFMPFLTAVNDIPFPTKVLIFSIKITTGPIAILSWIGGISGLVYLISNFLKTPEGRMYWDDIKIDIPIYGDVHRKQIVIQFCQTLASLYKSGLPLLRIMQVCIDGVNNAAVKKKIAYVQNLLEEGETLTRALKKTKPFFPLLMLDMLAIGEETGEIPYTLEKVSTFYSHELEYTLEQFGTLLEPIMLAILGFLVGFTVLGIFLPIYSVLKNI
ncbi:MAG: type II secretion system F family protein [Armatimonadetes bacterium]|nr:type II secretion system F family protein [Armatimonadota bacterium]